MANTIILKRSSTASSVPAAGSLQPGELAVNLADKKLYSKTTGGTVVQVGFGDLTSGMVTTALGYTPYNGSTNPNGYVTSSSPSFSGIPTAPTALANTGTTQIATTAFVLGQAGSSAPLINGSADAGTSTRFARQDHVHPTDTTRAPLASPTFTGTVTTATADLLGSVRQNVTTVAASAIDCSAGNVFTKTATGALTWTFTNVPASRAVVVILELTNGGTGTQTWPAAVKWPAGTAPTLTASGVDVLGFITDDGGTTWRGVQLMKDSK